MFVDKLFCHEVFQILVIFHVKIATPHEEGHHFENLVGGSTPPSRKGWCTHGNIMRSVNNTVLSLLRLKAQGFK